MECRDLIDVCVTFCHFSIFVFFFLLCECIFYWISYLLFKNLVSSQSSAHSNSSLGMNCATGNDWKLRKPAVRSAQGSTTPEMHSRRHSGGVSSLNQSRSKQIHQSNGSIQSDSPSSNSISPAPSPSPRPQSVMNTNNGSVGLGKRWNSTGDFNSQSALTGRWAMSIHFIYMYKFILLSSVHYSSILFYQIVMNFLSIVLRLHSFVFCLIQFFSFLFFSIHFYLCMRCLCAFNSLLF